MTMIAESGGRTVTNGCVHGMRKVYEIEAMAVLPEVQSVFGTGEVERTGRNVTETRIYHIVATSEPMARAFFGEHINGGQHTLIRVKPLFVIDGEIDTRTK